MDGNWQSLTRKGRSSLVPIAIAIGFSIGIAAQTTVREFAAVSIKRGAPGETWHLGMSRNGDGFEAINSPLWLTIEFAYFPTALVREERLQTAPGWVWNEKYDFVAKVDTADLSDWKKAAERSNSMVGNGMFQSMLQRALRQRCNLEAHLVPAETWGYALVVGKRGLNLKKLRRATGTETRPEHGVRINQSVEAWIVPYSRSDVDPAVTYVNVSMADLAAEMSALHKVAVLDRTEVTGRYDFRLPKISERGDPEDWDFNQLGLTLERIRVPVSNLVIDHIERPTPN